MGESRGYTDFWCGNLRARDHLEDPGVDGRIVLRPNFSTWNGGYGLDLAGSRQRQVVGTCECGNESSGSIKCGVSLSRGILFHEVSVVLTLLELQYTNTATNK